MSPQTSALAAFSHEVIGDAPCGFLSTDVAGKVIYVNETLARWLGYGDGHVPSELSIQDIFDKPSAMYFDAQISPMLWIQKFVSEISCQLAMRDCENSLAVLMNAKIRETAGGDIERIDFVFFDATERQRFEKTLRAARSESEELAAIVKCATIGIVRIGAEGQLKRWNATAERLFGGTVRPVEGLHIEEVLDLDAQSEGWFQVAKERVGQEGEYYCEVESSRGNFFHISVTEITNTHDPFAFSDYSIILRDVTRRIQNDKRLSVMVQELNHRVKNTFAIVSALVRQSLREPELQNARQKLMDRLQSVAASHSTLTAHYWQDIDISELMIPLVAQVNDPNRFEFDGPRVLLSSSQFKGISMAFHELMTNALKYGALSDEHGKVAVRWDIQGQDKTELSISWIESGGPKVTVPDKRGFGSAMLEDMLAMEFGGTSEISYPPEGLQFRFHGYIR